jgi:amino acid adenylation domain-containing protein
MSTAMLETGERRHRLDSFDNLVAWFRRHAVRRLDPTRAHDRHRLGPTLLAELGEAGLLRALASSRVGGLGLPERLVLRLVEQAAATSIGLSAFLVLHYTSSLPFEDFASPALRERILPDLLSGRALASLAITEPGAGSNLRGLATRVSRDASGGFVIDGRKTWIGHAEWAATLTTFARDEDGRISAFAVPGSADGVTVEPALEGMGVRAIVQNPVVFSNVKIDESRLLGAIGGGIEVAERSLSFGRLSTGAIAVGGMKRCAQIMARFAARRRVNTGLLADNAVTRERMANVHGAITAVTSLLDALCKGREEGHRVPPEAFMALKVAASELLWRTADETMQLLGSRGYDEANGVAAILRDARFLRIGEGPSETLLMQLGAAVAHGEPELRAYLRTLGGAEADDRLQELAVEARSLGERQAAEIVYDRLGAAAAWQLLASAAEPSADPAARFWVEQRRAEAYRRARRPEAVMIDHATWDATLVEWEHAIGSLEDSWPLPETRRDPLLRKDYTPEPEQRTERTSKKLVAAPPPAPRFIFRTPVPADNGFREFGVPQRWSPEAPLDATLVVSIEELAQRSATDLPTVICAAYAAFLSRLSCESELEMILAERRGDGTPCGGVRVDLAPGSSLETAIRAVAGAFSPTWVDPADAINARQLEGLVSNKLLVGGISTAFVVADNAAVDDTALRGVDLTLVCRREDREVFLEWRYDKVLFGPDTIARRHANFATFLDASMDATTADLRRVALLPRDEQDLLLRGMHGARTPPGYYRHTLHGLFESQADRTPDAVAIESGKSTLTYRDLELRANALAHQLRRGGVGPGEMVGVSCSRSASLVVGMLAALKAGGRFVILNADHPAERRAWLLEETEARALVVDELTVSDRSDAPKATAKVITISPLGEALDGDPVDTRPTTTTTPDDIAYVMFTSGSTGRPKGVLLPHRAICNQLLARRDELGLGPKDRVLQAAAPNFDISIWELIGPLAFGGRVVFSGEASFTWDPATIRRLVVEHGITVLQIVPSQLQLLLDELQDGEGSTLRFVISGGEALSKALQQKFFDSSATGLCNFYGPTEGAIDSTWWRCVRDEPSPITPIGRPNTNRLLYVLDEFQEPVPLGVAGELYIGGVGLALGYLKQPELTAEKFVQDPFSHEPGARMYRTGDRVRFRADGALEFIGRVDRQLKVRGVRIEPGEIEQVMCRHPLVSACAVVVRAAPSGDKRLVAYIAARGDVPSSKELRAFAQSSLPDEMIPSAFVVLEELPKTSTGKVSLEALPQVDWSALETTAAGGPPATRTERNIAKIWSELLGVPVDDAEADFFELGGHSLVAVQVLSRLRDELGVVLSVSELFEEPVLRPFSRRVATAVRAAGGDASIFQLPPEQPRTALRSIGGAVSGTPTFFAAEARTRAAGYDTLARSMKTPALLLVPPDEAPNLPREQLAARYAEEIRRHSAGSPVRLAGAGAAASLAFETAQILESTGDKVVGVLLLEPDAPTPAGGKPLSAGLVLTERESDEASERVIAWLDRASTRVVRLDAATPLEAFAFEVDHALTLLEREGV